MQVTIQLNGRPYTAEAAPDTQLLHFLRDAGCKSVKCGCETSGCGLCTVHMDGKPVLSCSVLAGQADGHTVTTLEGLQKEAEEFGGFLADQGGEQCGFCSPGFIMSVLAMGRELGADATDQEIREYLEGNLCRCTGYAGQMRAIRAWLDAREEKEVQACAM